MNRVRAPRRRDALALLAGVTLLPTAARADSAMDESKYIFLGGIRQWIESTFDTLKDQLSLERHGGRTLAGLISRITRRLLALTAVILHNWHNGNPGRHLTAYDH